MKKSYPKDSWYLSAESSECLTVCIDWCMPICNKCSTFENDEDTDGWRARRSVGHCEPCFKTKKPQTKNNDGGKQKQANDGRDRMFWRRPPCLHFT